MYFNVIVIVDYEPRLENILLIVIIMKIQKRDGSFQDLSFDKVTRRISNLKNDKDLGEIKGIDTDIVAQKVIQQIYDGVSTQELDVIASKICASMSIDNYQYENLASRIAISNMQKSTPKTFLECVELLNKDDILNQIFVENVRKNSNEIEAMIDHKRDYLLDFFGFSTCFKGYLLKDLTRVLERPQYMWMRVAVALHDQDLEKIKETYDNLSKLNFVHATPTLFNAGTKKQQLSSCFLLSSHDSVHGIFKTMSDVAKISKHAGGIGLTCSGIRAKGSKIKGTNGTSDGILPMLKVYNEIGRYINQGGKRNGSFAMFLETHHPDIEEFLEMKKNTGDFNLRARDLFYGLWVSDLFMECVEKDTMWYLMCPDECPGLIDCYGEEYKKLYNKYVEEKKYKKTIKARELWNAILVSQTETGTPYICYKDSINEKNNQKNLGTITSSNLCVAPETMILTSKGYFPIASLENKQIKVWNGEKFSETVVQKTGDNQELVKVKLSDGSSVECTKYHKFYTNTFQKLEAKDLKRGMKLLKSKMPVIEKGDDNFPHPYGHGASSVEKFDYNRKEFTVPLNCDLDTKLRWLEGIIDGGVNCNQIDSTNVNFLTDIKYMLNTMGCSPVISDGELKATYGYNDRKDFIKVIKRLFSLYLTKDDINTLQSIGFSPKRTVYNGISEEPLTVEEVEYKGRISDTYCFNEPEKNMGVFNGILTGNCVEITLYHDPNEYAVCNISSLCLGNCVKDGEFDFEMLGKLASIAVTNLNKVIDKNYYPVPETEVSNSKHRPVALGVQGLYDAFIKLRIPFTSDAAKELNKKIFECIQYHALKTSCELAQVDGPYSSFEGSPSSKGIFQHNMWGLDESKLNYDWAELRKDVMKYGLRNSMLTALPPTASTSNIMGNVSSFETITSNIFTRTVLSGNFPIVNKYLVRDLVEKGIWNTRVKDQIIMANGSIQGIKEIPQDLKDLYRTTWETSQKETINMSADRSPFIDQSQSLNIFMEAPTIAKLSSMHFHGWKKGLKTGSYYIRSQPISTPEKISVTKQQEILACSIDNKEGCMMCE